MSPLALSLRFLQTQSDAQLAALARAGHERAFEALVRRYRRELLAYCRRVGSAGTNAEDTLQQALLQAWSAIRTGVEVRDPRAWLYRIVHNVAVSNQRRPAVIPIELRDAITTNGADHEAEQRMAARDALAGLAALPALQREVMVGTAVDGMTHEELASALGLSSGAVRGLIYRARATLRAAAAAITPGPLISWALRTGSGPGAGVYEALAGGGSAGIGGLLVKGGVIAATAGAIATATGISVAPKATRHPAAPAASVEHHRNAARPTPASSASIRLFVADPTGSPVGARESRHSGSATTQRPAGSQESGDGFAGVTSGRGSAERPKGSDSSGGSDRGGRDGTSGTGGRRSGNDGSGPGSGSSNGGSGSGSTAPTAGSGSTTLPAGGSGSGDHGGSGSGTDGGISGSGGSPGSGASSGPGSGSPTGDSLSGAGSTVATVSSDGGGGSSGHDGGMTTTSTTQTTSGDGGSSGPGH